LKKLPKTKVAPLHQGCQTKNQLKTIKKF